MSWDHDIEFRPRTAIKTQALVDFVSEWTEQQVPDNPETAEVWRMYFDGSLKLQGAGAGILFIAPGGEQLKYALQLSFPASNNAAEYEALIHGLNIAISLGIKRLMVYGDSLVVISQINKEWDCSNDSMGKYCSVVQKLEDKFEGLEFYHVEFLEDSSEFDNLGLFVLYRYLFVGNLKSHLNFHLSNLYYLYLYFEI